MTRKLVVASIPDDFDPSTHAALGPWCFFQREHVYPDWDGLPYVDAFADPEIRGQRADDAIQTANALLDELWPEMNRRHGCNHGRDFWHTLLMNWLMHLVMLGWRYWANIALFVEHHGDEAFDVALLERQGSFRFPDTHEFIMSVFGESPFRTWLAYEITRRLAPAHWQLRQNGIISAPEIASSQLSSSKTWSAVSHVNGMNRLWSNALSAYVRLVPKSQYRKPEQNRPQGFPKSLPAGLLELLRPLLNETMPQILDEGFPTLLASVQTVRFTPGRLHICGPSYHSDQSNLLLALAAEAGERIVIAQHGGTYGWARTISMTGELEYTHHAFLSWGFTRHNDYQGRFYPMPSPLISVQMGKYQPQDDHMILVGAAMYGLNPRIDNYPDPVAYRKRKLEFIRALCPQLLGKLGYRPYHDPKFFEDADYLRRFYPDLKVVEGNLTQVMRRAKLVVQDHHSTTLSITLGANIPTIGIWDETAWPLGKDGKPLFDRLKAAKIVFDDPAEAARHIERIWPDVQGWWRSAEVQDARKAWARQFGWGSKYWWLHWLLRLPRL